jgi:hypothetical protein
MRPDTHKQWPGICFRIRGARDYVALFWRDTPPIHITRQDAARIIRDIRAAARRGLFVKHISASQHL